MFNICCLSFLLPANFNCSVTDLVKWIPVSLFCNNPDFNNLKSIVEGSLLGDSDNIKFYITSNLRHISDQHNENLNNNELIKKEMRLNLLSLSDRFALWIGFYDNNKEKYLETVKYYAKKLNKKTYSSKKALEWSISKGNYSGRTAFQYVKNIDN